MEIILSLEEKLRAYAAKGELVHMSLAFSNGEYHALFAAASPAGGYSSGHAADPVEAIVAALKASPVKPRSTHPRAKDPNLYGSADTTTVTEPKIMNGSELDAAWTTP